MKAFMDEDFLLTTDTAKELYHHCASKCPIIDYHNHLSVRELYERRTFENLSQFWLENDHYKWRVMRMNRVSERLVTGDGSEREKFFAFASIMPKIIGSPVYYWTHLELRRIFGIESPLNDNTAEEIWDRSAELLHSPGFDAVGILKRVGVKAVCTTDDPLDDLRWHKLIRDDDRFPFVVLPGFRPDRFFAVDKPEWAELMKRLSVNCASDMKAVLSASLDRFESLGCKVSDLSLTRFRYSNGNGESAMLRALAGKELNECEVAAYQTMLLRFLSSEYERRALVSQFHLGALRNNSPKLYSSFGPDAGADSIGEPNDPKSISSFLGELEDEGKLPKTILYAMHPADDLMLAAMAVNFASNGAKVQYGAAWWLQDTARGINEQLDILMETGALASTPGMLTDSRSVSSFVRHEYYRRILCAKLGAMVENGEIDYDIDSLFELVERICYKNLTELLNINW